MSTATFLGDEIAPILSRMPSALVALLNGLPAEQTARNEGGSSWNAAEVVGHLLHCERTDWMPRVRHLLEHGESVPFPPLDREAHRREAKQASVAELLSSFAAARATSLHGLEELQLSDDLLARTGLHPVFGRVTLRQLLAAWAAHDLTHLHQLSRLLAEPLRDATGPWSAFLGVLHCNGHGA